MQQQPLLLLLLHFLLQLALSCRHIDTVLACIASGLKSAALAREDEFTALDWLEAERLERCFAFAKSRRQVIACVISSRRVCLYKVSTL